MFLRVLWERRGGEGGRERWLTCGIDPVISACVGTAWCVSRVAYTIGYCRKDKSDGSGRLIGAGAGLLEFGLIIMSGLTGYQMIMD